MISAPQHAQDAGGALSYPVMMMMAPPPPPIPYPTKRYTPGSTLSKDGVSKTASWGSTLPPSPSSLSMNKSVGSAMPPLLGGGKGYEGERHRTTVAESPSSRWPPLPFISSLPSTGSVTPTIGQAGERDRKQAKSSFLSSVRQQLKSSGSKQLSASSPHSYAPSGGSFAAPLPSPSPYALAAQPTGSLSPASPLPSPSPWGLAAQSSGSLSPTGGAFPTPAAFCFGSPKSASQHSWSSSPESPSGTFAGAAPDAMSKAFSSLLPNKTGMASAPDPDSKSQEEYSSTSLFEGGYKSSRPAPQVSILSQYTFWNKY